MDADLGVVVQEDKESILFFTMCLGTRSVPFLLVVERSFPEGFLSHFQCSIVALGGHPKILLPP